MLNQISTEELRHFIVLISEILEKRIEETANTQSRPSTIYDQRRKTSKLVDISQNSTNTETLLKPATLPDPTKNNSPEPKRLRLNTTNRFTLLDDLEDSQDQTQSNMDTETIADSEKAESVNLTSSQPPYHKQDTQIQNSNSENLKPASPKVPPIVLRDKSKWNYLSNVLKILVYKSLKPESSLSASASIRQPPMISERQYTS